jgi:menaquinone-9 beta-reductase
VSKPGDEWDAIIVGASFGGLAAAIELAGSGRVLLLDRRQVGEGQTSACATPLSVLERLRALDAVEQVHSEIVVHTPDGRTAAVTPDFPFATFDYRKLCELLRSRTDAAFYQAVVYGRDGDTVRARSGSYRAPVVIDASGWRAVASGGHQPGYLSVGIEVDAPLTGEGLHLWLRPPELECGMAWVFPAGTSSRIGVGCYRGRGRLRAPLAAFFPASSSVAAHGGRLPSRFRRPVVDGVFRVGDAAGQCLPVTGEGIRPALVFGQVAGRRARGVLTGECALKEALSAYAGFVQRRAPYYGFLSWLQDVLVAIPRPLASTFVRLMAAGYQSGPGLRSYWWAADPMFLGEGGGTGSVKADSQVA